MQKNGHFDSANSLLERGVWIGYIAEESRGTQYRQLPSFRELETNHRNINLPCPPLLPHTTCTDREAVCRGCFGEGSSILQLREIRFGSNSKVVIMPLKGADEAGLFCIMLPRPQDRSIKALEMLRPYEHSPDREDHENRLFANNYMLLAIRDRKNKNGLIHMVNNTLSPVELAKIANRTDISRLSLGSNGQTTTKSTAETTRQSGRQLRLKRKLQQTNGEDPDATSSVKRDRSVPPKSMRMSEDIVLHSDDDVDDLTLLQRFRHQIPVLPSHAPGLSLLQKPQLTAINMNNLQFTDEQARRIHFVWEISFEDMEIEVRRTLSGTSTFRGLLDSFQEEANLVPSATQQIKADLWIMKYKLADGKGKAVFVKPSSPDFEHSFDSIMRSLAEKEEWKQDKSVIVEIELRAVMSGGAE